MAGVEISVVVPARGRPERLGACLAALERQSYPGERFEVIVVDDGSQPPLAPRSGSLQFSLIRQDNAGPAAARNSGAARARGTFLAFTDDDCLPTAGWLAELVASLNRYPGSLVGGAVLNGLAGNQFAAASQLLVGYLYSYYNEAPGRARFFTSNNIAMPANRYRELGGFDPAFPAAAGEDRWFCESWRSRGWPMWYCPGAVVLHHHAMGWSGFWRQHFRYGQAAHEFHRKRAAASGAAIRLEPGRFYRDLLLFPWSRGEARPIRMAALLGISQLANALGYARARLGSPARGP